MLQDTPLIVSTPTGAKYSQINNPKTNKMGTIMQKRCNTISTALIEKPAHWDETQPFDWMICFCQLDKSSQCRGHIIHPNITICFSTNLDTQPMHETTFYATAQLPRM